MVGAVAGAAAAAFGLAAAGVEVRRRLVIRARIARRLSWMVRPKYSRLFRLPSAPAARAMAEDADPA